MVLDFKILTHFLHHLVVQIGGVIGDDFPGQPLFANYLFLNESDHDIPSHASI